jgi:hypothetical protein
VHKRDTEGNFILSDWSNVSMEEYNDFRVVLSLEYQSARAGLPNPNTAHSISQATPPFAKVRDPLSDYWNNTRRDPNAFNFLKEDKQWDSWQRGTIAQARAQDLSEILDSNFFAATPEAIQNFLVRSRSFSMLALTRSCSLTKANCLSGSMQALLMPRRSFLASLCKPTPQPWQLRKLRTC